MDACWAYDALHSFLFGVTDVVMKLLIGRPLSSNPYATLHLHSQRCNSRSTYALRLQNKYNLQSSGWQAKENGEGQESQSKLNDGDHQQPAQHFQCTPWKDDRLLLLQSCENDRYRLDVKPLPVFNQPMVKVIDDLLVRMEKPIHQPRLGPLAPPNWRALSGTSASLALWRITAIPAARVITTTTDDTLYFVGYEVKLLVSQYLDPIFKMVWSRYRHLNYGKPMWDTYLHLYRLVFSHEITPHDLRQLPTLAAALEGHIRALDPTLKITYLFHQTYHIDDAIRHLGMPIPNISHQQLCQVV